MKEWWKKELGAPENSKLHFESVSLIGGPYDGCEYELHVAFTPCFIRMPEVKESNGVRAVGAPCAVLDYVNHLRRRNIKCLYRVVGRKCRDRNPSPDNRVQYWFEGYVK